MRLVLMGVHVAKSVDASITLVRPAWPWMKSNAPSFEKSVILILGGGTKTATTFVWLNRVGASTQIWARYLRLRLPAISGFWIESLPNPA